MIGRSPSTHPTKISGLRVGTSALGLCGRRTLGGHRCEAPLPRGFSLLETIFALTVSAIATLTAVTGLDHFQSAMALRTAGQTVVLALRQAQREAYLRDETVEVQLKPGTTQVLVLSGSRDPKAWPLPAGIEILAAPQNDRVAFYPAARAQNATIRLRAKRSGRERKVVVNQRGRIR